MIILNEQKQSWERYLYTADCTAGLPDGVTVISATVSSIECLNASADTALTADSPLIVASPSVQVWLNAGTNGCKYKVTLYIICSNTQRIEAEIILKIKNL